MSKYQNYSDYIADAKRTLSPKFEVDENSLYLLENTFKLMMCLEVYGHHLDVLKKRIFYNKPILEIQNYVAKADIEKFQEHYKANNVDFNFDLSSITEQEKIMLHCLIGMITETIELATPFINYFCAPSNTIKSFKNKLDLANIVEELGDLHWYMSQFIDELNLDHNVILEKNIAKLKTRYPEKFTSENAINRDLEAERKTLE
jgi:NTP pyrophosphatase (non-canonical NTP hydrolase)